jgi:hypothetical protein
MFTADNFEDFAFWGIEKELPSLEYDYLSKDSHMRKG